MASHHTDSGSLLKAVDFFCGAGGMSLGLAMAGIDVLAGIDVDEECGRTYRANIPGAEFIWGDVSQLAPADLESKLGIHSDDPNLVLAACSPCQHYSQIRTDKTKSKPSARLLHEFQKFVVHFRPGLVVIENVPRLAKEAVLAEFLDTLAGQGYKFAGKVLNASDYGVPQNRMRYLLIASRIAGDVSLPLPSGSRAPTVHDFIGRPAGFKSIPAGHRDDSDFQHTTATLEENNLLRISMTPPDGGQRSAWAEHPRLQLDAYRNRPEIFRDSYGRMYWDRPAPTITTKFLSISNGRFGHPSEARGLSVREGATLQGFPKSFKFHAPSLHGLARQIGNAVPPPLAQRLGVHLVQLASAGRHAATPPKTDGRVSRARATLDSVRKAHVDLVSSGVAPTASAILSITGGSKPTVLRYLRIIRAEEGEHSATSTATQNSASIAQDELLPILGRLFAGTKIAERKGATPTPAQVELLRQALSHGYIDLVLTPSGASRLKRDVKLPTIKKLEQ